MAHRVGRRLRTAFPCECVGFVVHGFGVAHAHLLLVPQHGPHDVTSARFARVRGGEVQFDLDGIERPPRAVLDRHAETLRA